MTRTLGIEHVVPTPKTVTKHYASESTPCGCSVDTFEGIDSVPVQHLSRYNHPPVERLRCTLCGCMWWNDWSLDERRIRGEFDR